MIFTSNYNNCQSNKLHKVSISNDKRDDINYRIDSYPLLYPLKEVSSIWQDNAKSPNSEVNTYLIEEYYKQVLSKLNPLQVYLELDNSVLLSDEESCDLSHRHIVAAWLELILDIEVPEIKVNNNEIEIIKRPEYIKNTLRNIINKNRKIKSIGVQQESITTSNYDQKLLLRYLNRK